MSEISPELTEQLKKSMTDDEALTEETEVQVVDGTMVGNEILQRLLDIQEMLHVADVYDFSYPADGTRVELAAGDTTIDYRAGTVRSPAGAITKLSSSLEFQSKDFLRSLLIDTDQDIVLQLDSNDMVPIRADPGFIMTYQQFQRVTITCTETTNLFIRAASREENTLMYVAPENTIRHIDSDKDTHFTTAIAQNAIETEDITGLSANRITITGVSVQTKEAKSYRIWLFGTDGHTDTDIDVDEFITSIAADMVTDGEQVAGVNQYYYSKMDLNIGYEDIDSTKELHIALQNLDAGAKTAGAAGAVKIKVFYIQRT